ncbi:uncharacterized protein LOC106667444 [Cimex lectularius]|uniref:Uncharacterized protein n=1 Tax=Cimex lectularius TaxID=79782 RepID=A0A8I6RTY7_CIMLE|nr:uncharacterized protein LOC106667444 [Cimex lectularius]
MYGGSFLWTVFITLNIFVLVYNGCAYADASTVSQRILSGDELNLKHLIGLRKNQTSFDHAIVNEMSPTDQNLTREWLVFHLNDLKFDLAQMTSSASETDKNLIKQLDRDYWHSVPLINDTDSAFTKYEYILTIFDHQMEHNVHSPADLETPYWKTVEKFLLVSLFG